MTDVSQTPTLTLEARIQFASSGDGLRRWYRLRRLWNELHSADGYSTGELEKLVVAIEASFDAAAGEAEAVAALLEANAEQINAVLATGNARAGAPEDVRRYFGNPGSDDARRVAQRLRGLPARRSDEIDSLRGRLGEGRKEPVPAIESTAFCSIAEYLFIEAYGECESGSAAACKQASGYLNDLLAYCPL
jgi:hypothetical protein